MSNLTSTATAQERGKTMLPKKYRDLIQFVYDGAMMMLLTSFFVSHAKKQNSPDGPYIDAHKRMFLSMLKDMPIIKRKNLSDPDSIMECLIRMSTSNRTKCMQFLRKESTSWISGLMAAVGNGETKDLIVPTAAFVGGINAGRVEVLHPRDEHGKIKIMDPDTKKYTTLFYKIDEHGVGSVSRYHSPLASGKQIGNEILLRIQPIVNNFAVKYPFDAEVLRPDFVTNIDDDTLANKRAKKVIRDDIQAQGFDPDENNDPRLPWITVTKNRVPGLVVKRGNRYFSGGRITSIMVPPNIGHWQDGEMVWERMLFVNKMPDTRQANRVINDDKPPIPVNTDITPPENADGEWAISIVPPKEFALKPGDDPYDIDCASFIFGDDKTAA